MTTTPTPELIAKWRLLAEANDGSFYVIPVLNALDEAATACEALIAERVETCKMIDRRTTERDQALARERDVMELLCHAQEERDKAVALLDVERATSGKGFLQADLDRALVRAEKAEARVAVLREIPKKAWCLSCLDRAADLFVTEDQAAEALLAERDGLKAQLDVAVECLEGIDRVPSWPKLLRDHVHVSLAKIKELG